MNGDNGKGRNLKRTGLIALGTLLGLFFLYLSFRDISWREFVNGLREMRPVYFLPAVIVAVLAQLVRALRFKIIVSPFCSLDFKSSWDIINIWAGASMLAPARLGELVRPYLLVGRGASFSSSFGAVLVERFFDLSGLLVLTAVVLWKTPQVPPVYSSVGKALLLMIIAGYALILLILARRDTAQSIVEKMLSWLPAKAASFLGGIFRRLIDGFGIMASFKQALLIFVYSVLLWTVFSFLTYLFLLAFSIDAPFLVAVTIQVFICFWVALPSAPGFIGTFHAAGRYALALFGIHAVVAVSFATVYHLFSLLSCLSLATFSYLTSNFRFDHVMIEGRLKSRQHEDLQVRVER